jgi:class 3 adenylate cyclase
MPVCSDCGEENPDRARFCLTCGTPLIEASQSERRERRVVSVLFADLAGFTSRSESLDVEDVDGFLAPYLAVLRSEVERTGGVVVKFTGDGVMAVFGADIAHEDDPERAVRAGLGICERMADAGDPDLRVRVGVTSGEALVSHGVGGAVDAVGDVVNTAARLEAAAPVDGVLVDGRSYRATERAIRYEPAEAIVAKGKSEPVEAWVAVAPRSIVPEQTRVEGLALVGRDGEVELLRGVLDRSCREPSTQLVSVIGEPGIGKSRLVEELLGYVEELPELITWRRGRSLAYGEGVAFWALGEMIKSQAGILESDAAAVADAKLGEAVDAVILDQRDRTWVTRHLRPLVGVETDGSSGGQHGQSEAFAAWRRFFEALAEDGPTVLWFEDIHWADDALLDFIDLLADRAGAVPLLIVCTARPELFQRRPSWGGGKPNASTQSLTALSSGDTARLVASLLDQALLPAEVQTALLERAEGNPLYAQEYVRMLQDRGLLTEGDGGWQLAGDVEGLPESIHGIIAARLDTLSDDERVFIEDASVIGKTAWRGAVCTLTERTAWQADELLHLLERKQLVQRARRSSIEGETEFNFSHALTRDVAYSQIRRADRAQKHEAAAEWIERLSGERDDKAELLADHYTNALTLREHLGEDTARLAPRARAAFTEAAHQAAAVYAHPAAARHYHAALTLTPLDDTQQRAELLLGEATALVDAETADEQTLQTAVDAQVTAKAWEAAARAELGISFWYENHEGRGEEADMHLALAADYAARVPPGEAMCHIAADQAYRFFITGRAEEALALANRVIPIAEQAHLEVSRALLLQWRGAARVTLGDANGVSDMREAADTLAKHIDPSTPRAYGNLADALRGLGDLPAADDAYAIAAPLASRFARPQLIDLIAAEQAYQAYHAAHWDTAQRLLTQIDSTNQMTEDSIRVTRGRIALARGDTHSAVTDATATVTYAVRAHNDDSHFYGSALEVLCQVAAGRDAAALEACQRFLSRWQETGGMTTRAIELCEIAPTLATASRHQEIGDAALPLPEASRWRDALLHVAEQRYAAAAGLYDEIGSQPLAADAHLLAAQQAADQGRTADANQHAEAVLAFAEQTGAMLYRQRAEVFLRASA